MVGKLLLRGMLIGILAGMLAVGFGKLFGEPLVERAIAIEDSLGHTHGDMPEPEVVSRETQSGLGLLTAGVMYGAGLGGFFALAFVLAFGRIGAFDARQTSVLVAAAAFLAVTVVPMLKYPASPPSVGAADTIGLRTALFFGMIVLSALAAIGAVAAGRRIAVRQGAWTGAIGAGAIFLVVVGAACALLPGVNEVPDSFPAVTLWNFRIVSLGMQAIVWLTLGLGFGWLAQPLMRTASAARRPSYAA